MSLVEVLDKAMKYEQSKQTKFVFQKKNTVTAVNPKKTLIRINKN